MAFITEWIMNIVVFILLAMIVDMLLPNSGLKKYTKMVTGLLLIAIILTPLLKVVAKDFDQVVSSFSNKNFVDKSKIENLIETKKKEIQAVQDEYTLEQVAVQMKKDVEEELIDRFGKDIQNIDIKQKKQKVESENQIDKVIVYLGEAESENSVQVIEAVNININGDKLDKEETSNDSEKIIATLSKRWNLTTNQIELHIEGGGRDLNGQ
ncbi:stage III sporulation protein AF [Heyndrickxia sp. NPDC080065]|uniref:stage III sporulation protein AF n=1 Tax=Heyndrickxia sp. NPDC080065 TaxID=3390568 RepID=UPI003D07C03D